MDTFVKGKKLYEPVSETTIRLAKHFCDRTKKPNDKGGFEYNINGLDKKIFGYKSAGKFRFRIAKDAYWKKRHVKKPKLKNELFIETNLNEFSIQPTFYKANLDSQKKITTHHISPKHSLIIKDDLDELRHIVFKRDFYELSEKYGLQLKGCANVAWPFNDRYEMKRVLASLVKRAYETPISFNLKIM